MIAGSLSDLFGRKRVFVAGLATDFCVLYTAIDGREAGFDVSLANNACRGIDVDGSLAGAMRQMSKAGVRIGDE